MLIKKENPKGGEDNSLRVLGFIILAFSLR